VPDSKWPIFESYVPEISDQETMQELAVELAETTEELRKAVQTILSLRRRLVGWDAAARRALVQSPADEAEPYENICDAYQDTELSEEPA
jgi:hypothetical protein|tara:strand:+ start:886 stop:1155 length:270 start_codon:yes stop_codon:yes gene_type:complete